jgi:hypothetical protein
MNHQQHGVLLSRLIRHGFNGAHTKSVVAHVWAGAIQSRLPLVASSLNHLSTSPLPEPKSNPTSIVITTSHQQPIAFEQSPQQW